MQCNNVRKSAAAADSYRHTTILVHSPYINPIHIVQPESYFTFNGVWHVLPLIPELIFAFILTVARLKSLSNDIQRKVMRRSATMNTPASDVSGSI